MKKSNNTNQIQNRKLSCIINRKQERRREKIRTVFFAFIMLVAGICAQIRFYNIPIFFTTQERFNYAYKTDFFQNKWDIVYHTRQGYNDVYRLYVFDTKDTIVDKSKMDDDINDDFINWYKTGIERIKVNQTIDSQYDFKFEGSYQWLWIAKLHRNIIYYKDDPIKFMNEVDVYKVVACIYVEEANRIYEIQTSSH